MAYPDPITCFHIPAPDPDNPQTVDILIDIATWQYKTFGVIETALDSAVDQTGLYYGSKSAGTILGFPAAGISHANEYFFYKHSWGTPDVWERIYRIRTRAHGTSDYGRWKFGKLNAPDTTLNSTLIAFHIPVPAEQNVKTIDLIFQATYISDLTFSSPLITEDTAAEPTPIYYGDWAAGTIIAFPETGIAHIYEDFIAGVDIPEGETALIYRVRTREHGTSVYGQWQYGMVGVPSGGQPGDMIHMPGGDPANFNKIDLTLDISTGDDLTFASPLEAADSDADEIGFYYGDWADGTIKAWPSGGLADFYEWFIYQLQDPDWGVNTLIYRARYRDAGTANYGDWQFGSLLKPFWKQYSLYGRGIADTYGTFQLNGRGVSGMQQEWQLYGRGVHNIVINRYNLYGRGTSYLRNAFVDYGRGWSRHYGIFNIYGRGVYRIFEAPTTYQLYGRGWYALGLVSRILYGRGHFKFLSSYSAYQRGYHRIANDSLIGYELYRGVDAAPDFDAAPWETFTTLPHDSAALDPSHTYHFALRRRNAWDLVSQNIFEWTLELDGDGNLVVTKPSAPTEISLTPAAAGAVRVKASYYYDLDGEDQATQFLIYLTSDGSNPDPEIDEPVVVSMVKSDGRARLNYLTSEYADDLTIKAIVRTRRVDAGPVNVDSTNTTIYSTTSDTDGPTAPVGPGIFFGKIAEQHQ